MKPIVGVIASGLSVEITEKMKAFKTPSTTTVQIAGFLVIAPMVSRIATAGPRPIPQVSSRFRRKSPIPKAYTCPQSART